MGKKKCGFAAVAGILMAAVVALGGVSAFAAGGSQGDPLVTLSYLTQVVTPQIMQEVDKQIDASEQEFEKKLNAAIDDYSSRMEGSYGQDSQSGATFSVVSFEAGQTLRPGVGCEMLLRFGSGKLSSDSSPGLMDITTGTSLENGKSLVSNHLYLTTVEGRSITFSASGKILIRGGYTLT